MNVCYTDTAKQQLKELKKYLTDISIKMSRSLPSGALRASRSTRAAVSLNIFESDDTMRSTSRAASLMTAELGGGPPDINAG